VTVVGGDDFQVSDVDRDGRVSCCPIARLGQPWVLRSKRLGLG
jgi:hypothetical protein